MKQFATILALLISTWPLLATEPIGIGVSNTSNPVGKWRFEIGDKSFIRTFNADGTITGDGVVGTGNWRVSKGKIVISYPNGHVTKVDLPLKSKGTKAEGDGGKQTLVKVN